MIHQFIIKRDNAILAHFTATFGSQVYSTAKWTDEAHVNDSLYELAAAYIKNQLIHYTNQRSKAYAHTGTLSEKVYASISRIEKVAQMRSAHNIIMSVINLQSDIDLLLPHPDSRQAYWRNIIASITKYANDYHNHYHKKQEQQISAAH